MFINMFSESILCFLYVVLTVILEFVVIDDTFREKKIINKTFWF